MATDRPMQLGMVGLGRMGANLVRRLMRDGHRCVAYDRNPDAVKSLEAEGANGASSYEELVRKLDRPRNIWIMIPAGVVQPVLDQLVPLLDPADIVIDGGGSSPVCAVGRTAAEARAAGLQVTVVSTPTGEVAGAYTQGIGIGIGGTSQLVIDDRRRTIVGATFTGPGLGRAAPVGHGRNLRGRDGRPAAARRAVISHGQRSVAAPARGLRPVTRRGS
jgi:6-phosphogluconate dehydrogenase